MLAAPKPVIVSEFKAPVWFAVSLSAIALERSDRTIGRGRFALWFLCAYCVAPFLLGIFKNALASVGMPVLAVDAIVLLAYCGILFDYHRLLVQRLREAGHPRKTIAYVATIPIINLLIGIYAIIEPPAGASDRQIGDAA